MEDTFSMKQKKFNQSLRRKILRSYRFGAEATFNKHGYNFDDVSKNGYLRPS